jgi:hypothetical protein
MEMEVRFTYAEKIKAKANELFKAGKHWFFRWR